MGGKLVGLDVDQISTGNNDVGIDVVAKLIDSSLKLLVHAYNSLGSEITPLIAEAASVAGLHK
jgi:hypothetical protein